MNYLLQRKECNSFKWCDLETSHEDQRCYEKELAMKNECIQNLKDDKLVLIQEIKQLQNVFKDRYARDRKYKILGIVIVLIFMLLKILSQN